MKKETHPAIVLTVFYEIIILILLIGALIPSGATFWNFLLNPITYMQINEFVIVLTFALFLPLVYKNIQKVRLFGAEVELRQEVTRVKQDLSQIKKDISDQKYDYERAMFAILSRLSGKMKFQPRRLSSNLEEVPIEIGSLDFGESWILTQIFYRKLEAINMPVARPSLGETTLMTFFNMISGKIDLFVWYSGTGMALAGIDVKPHGTEDGRKELNDLYKKWGLKWLKPLGFETREGLVMLGEKADRFKIKTMTDLAEKSHRMVFGANREYFLRHWAYPRLKRLGMRFRKTTEVLINDRLSGLYAENFDVGIGYTTDPEINDSRLTVIEYDKRFEPISQFAMPLCRIDVADQVTAALDDFEITTKQMREMNFRAKKGNYKKLMIAGLADAFQRGQV